MAADTATSAVPTPDLERAEAPVVKRRVRPWESPSLRITVPPFLLTLIVSLIGIGNRQQWADENATWWAASLPLGDLRKLVETVDVVLLPYYVFMHGWMALFGDSETAMRIPSVLSMALAAAVVALVGRRFFDAPAGLLSGLLVALVPAISRYGQEARPYAMATLAGITAVWLLLRALERPTVWRWAGYAAAVIAIGCTHIVGAMALAAHLVLVVQALRRTEGGERRRLLIGWPAAVVVAVLVFSPLVLRGRTQGGQISWIPDNTWDRVQEFPAEVFMSAGVAGFLVTLGLGSLVVLAFEKQRWLAGFLTVWAFLPPLIAYYTFDTFHFFYPRYMLFTVPAWLLLSGFALRRFTAGPVAEGPRAAAKLAAAGLAAAAALTFVGYDQQAEIRGDVSDAGYSYREAAAFIAAHDEPGDGIVFTGYPYTHRGFRYEWRDLPVARQPREILVQVPKGREYSWVHPACKDVVACLGTTERIWIVSTDPDGGVLSQLPAAQRAAIEPRYDFVQRTLYHRLRVTEMIRRTAG